MTTAFDRLHPDIQRVLWDMKWEKLRDLQVNAIGAWLDRDVDIILMADTASGKTEAAFLPVLSTLAPDKGSGSVRALYIGPLKALINDQFRRIEELCKRAEISVHRWHGDVSGSHKQDLLKSPSGILLITPESLEALFMRKGRDVGRIFRSLDAIVIDEMHCFLDSERGRQLCSLMARIDEVRNGQKRVRRVGLSATIGDPEKAKHWLRGDTSSDCEVITSSGTRDIELLIKTLVHEGQATVAITGADQETEPVAPEETVNENGGILAVAEHIYRNFPGKTNLVFCNSKYNIEVLADFLQKLCRRENRPNEFFVHHGSLGKALREQAESELQSGRPCTALCSSTLELGIDVGKVDSIGQVEPPHSVSALKQRLGRSGRRAGTPSRLWLYVPVLKHPVKDPLPHRLYPSLLQSVSLTELLLEKWIEPPSLVSEDFSTLIQQILSLIVERGGVSAFDAYRILCKTSVFASISRELFVHLLQDLVKADLVEQASNEDLILGLEGERLTSHYDFYAAFETPDEFDVIEGTHHIGSIEYMPGIIQLGENIILAGKRWEIVDIDKERKVIIVQKSHKKKPVIWTGKGGHIHKKVREKMKDLLSSDAMPDWLNQTSRNVLEWARSDAIEAGVTNSRWINDGEALWLFTWAGSKAHHTLWLFLLSAGWLTRDFGLAFAFDGDIDPSQIKSALSTFLSKPPEPAELVRKVFEEVLLVEVPPTGKHGEHLSPSLRARAYASAHLDIPETIECAKALVSGDYSTSSMKK